MAKALAPALSRLVAAEEKGRPALEKGHGEDELATLRAAVDRTLEPYASTATGDKDAVELAEQTRDGVYLYALDLMETGRAPESAGRIAADTLVNEKFYYLETYRVPRDRDVTAIQAHTDAILKKKQDGATGIDPDPMQWRNTPDGGGLMLVDATGGQVIAR